MAEGNYQLRGEIMAELIFWDMVNIEVQGGRTFRSFCNRIISEGDGYANVFGVRMFNNGQPYNPTGCVCTGYFIRPDGITLICGGYVVGNEAYVQLPPAAYAKEGNYTLAIKVSGNGVFTTTRIVDGTVNGTTTGNVSDPSSAIPDIATVEALIEDAEEAAAPIEKLHVSVENITGTRNKLTVTKDE